MPADGKERWANPPWDDPHPLVPCSSWGKALVTEILSKSFNSIS